MAKKHDPRLTTVGARLTVITTRSPNLIGKEFSLRDGKLQKGSTPWMTRGDAHIRTVKDLSEFAGLLQELEPGRQVLTFGLPKAEIPPEGLPVVREVDLPDWAAGSAVSRTKEHFDWSRTGGAIALLDHDPVDGEPGLSAHDLSALLAKACPALGRTQQIWWASSSSFIYTPDGTDLTGNRGMRGYVLLKDAQDLPRAMRVLHRRLWLSGHGRVVVSQSGQLLERGPLDATVWSPERVDYASGAVCHAGLRQDRGEPQLLNPEGPPFLDSATALPDLTPAEAAQYAALVRLAKDLMADEARQVRDAWATETHLAEIIRTCPEAGDDPDLAFKLLDQDRERGAAIRRLADADPSERVVLPLNTEIFTAQGTSVRLADIARNPDLWDGRPVCDPLEPGYRNWSLCATCFARNRRIVSHAHGLGRVFEFGTWRDLVNSNMGRVLALLDSHRAAWRAATNNEQKGDET